jgi:hypothetical protein
VRWTDYGAESNLSQLRNSLPNLQEARGSDLADVSMIRQFIHERKSCPESVDRSRFFVLQGASHRDEFV